MTTTVDGVYSTGTVTYWQRMLAIAKEAREPTSCFMLITPECAKVMLGFNVKNRKPNVAAAGSYTSDMNDGNFFTTMQGIAFGFDEEGNLVLLDGQTRLMAVVASGKSVVLLVGFGMPATTAAYYDRGPKRTTAQAFAMAPDTKVDPSSHIATTFAVAKQVVDILHDGNFTNLRGHDEVRRWYVPIKPSVDWAVHAFASAKPLNNSCIAGPLAVAHIFYPREIEAFGAKLVDLNEAIGVLTISPDDPARDFIRVLMKLKNIKGGFGGGSRDRIHVTRTFLNGLHALVTRKAVKKALHDSPTGLDFFSSKLRAVPELAQLKTERDVLLAKAREAASQFAAKRGRLDKVGDQLPSVDADREKVYEWLCEHTDWTDPNRQAVEYTTRGAAFHHFRAVTGSTATVSLFNRYLLNAGVRGEGRRTGGLPFGIKKS